MIAAGWLAAGGWIAFGVIALALTAVVWKSFSFDAGRGLSAHNAPLHGGHPRPSRAPSRSARCWCR
jgi:hypothetical protein